jgi:hypothetical protein
VYSIVIFIFRKAVVLLFDHNVVVVVLAARIGELQLPAGLLYCVNRLSIVATTYLPLDLVYN